MVRNEDEKEFAKRFDGVSKTQDVKTVLLTFHHSRLIISVIYVNNQCDLCSPRRA